MKLFNSMTLGMIFFGSTIQALSAESVVKQQLISNLYTLRGIYEAQYAPAAWKQHFADWILDEQINEAVKKAERPNLTVKEAQKILKDFIYSMKDYHVSIRFFSTESASLPFSVTGAEGKVFVSYIDRQKLTKAAFPFEVGDELIQFNGKPVVEEIEKIQHEFTENVVQTDRSLAELRLTNRSAARGLTVPRGPVLLGIKPKGSESIRTIQLIWDYSEEKIDSFSSMSTPPNLKVVKKSKFFSPEMGIDFSDLHGLDNPYGLGNRKSFIPDLGTKTWQSTDDNEFYAYTFQRSDGRNLGYIRIPSYVPSDFDKAVADFKKTINLFEATTDGLVIDQVNNPGGSVFYLYALVSALTENAIYSPRHRMTITQSQISETLPLIPLLEKVKSDDDAQQLFGGSLSGYDASYEASKFFLEHLRFLVSEWKQGHRLTDPFWIMGVDHINSSNDHYSKPILLLTNELDFSGGDFFPAILQDNKRVTILGSRTAGAGGYVNDVSFPNALGIESVRVTGSIASRIDENPIENLGIVPDVSVSITKNDVQNGYTDYIGSVHRTLDSLIK